MIFSSVVNLFNFTRSKSLALINKLNRSMSSSGQNKSILIFLHGLGDCGSSWAVQLCGMMPSNVKCICPTAPMMSVTLNAGERMHSWFDLRSLNPNDPEDEVGIEAQCKEIHGMISEHEKQGISHNRIMLGGFSQGGALALYAALTYPKRLAGVVALSSWLPLHRKVPSIVSEENKAIPVLQCHGDSDWVVPMQWGKMSEQVLSTILDTSKCEFKVYPNMGHMACPQEIDDVLQFITTNLPK